MLRLVTGCMIDYMSKKSNKFSKRSGWINVNDDRPDWQKDRGERYGNNRRWKAKEKWLARKKDRRTYNEDIDFL
jgi:hypothetical protein